jgi:hypothetical protein
VVARLAALLIQTSQSQCRRCARSCKSCAWTA